jgi:integrase
MMAGHIARRRYENTNGSIRTRWRARYPDPKGAGSTAQIERTFLRKADAEGWLLEQQASIMTGSHVAPRDGGRRFAEVYAAWSETRWPGLQPTTAARYGQIWRTYLQPEFASRKLNTITREVVRKYFARLTREGKAPGTVRKVHAVMSAIMAEAVDLGYAKVNPCAGVKGLPRPERREMLYLTAEEVLLLADTVTPFFRTLILFAAYTGMRSSEIHGLRWRCVDLLHGRVTVAESLKEVGGTLVFGPPKTHEVRTISLPTFLRDELAARGPGAGDSLVFPGRQGGPMRHHLFYRRHFRPAVAGHTDRDGVRHPGALPHKAALRFHDLRHTCAALLIGQGAHAKLIQQRLGHSSITVTLDQYGHLLPSLEAALAEQLDAVYEAAMPAQKL